MTNFISPNKAPMLIGQLAKCTGFSRDTIRFYEKQGLIALPRKSRRDNNYKEYPDEVLERLLSIKRIKEMGFTLNETAEILELVEMDEATCASMLEKVNAKVDVIDAKIAELKALRDRLTTSVENCLSTCNSPLDAVLCGLVVK